VGSELERLRFCGKLRATDSDERWTGGEDVPSGVSDYGSSTWLSALFGVVPLPTQYYIALTSREPGAAMDGDMLAGIEPSDPAYQRSAYPTGAMFWAANGPYLTNLVAATFPLPEVDWGYLTHFALCNAADGGRLLAWGQMFNPQFVTRSIGVVIPPGGMVLGLHALDSTIAA
jgi:hypothetical protein